MFDKHITRMHFERAADSYDSAAALQRNVAERLFNRLNGIDLSLVKTETILDVGCGTGYITKELLKRFPESELLALDIAHSMLNKTKLFDDSQRLMRVCADAESLPLKENSINFLTSGLMLQWTNDLEKTLSGFHHVLEPNGLLLFSTFGPKTLIEIRQSWSEVDKLPHTSQFINHNEIKNTLLRSGFVNPMIDSEIITMSYDTVRQLMREIKRIGASNTESGRSKGLMGKAKLQAFESAYERFKTSEGYPASWEIIYGYAWADKQA